MPSAIGSFYGGALYDAQGMSRMALTNSIIHLSVLIVFLVVLYGYKPDLNILDYETLDGTRPVKQFKASDST